MHFFVSWRCRYHSCNYGGGGGCGGGGGGGGDGATAAIGYIFKRTKFIDGKTIIISFGVTSEGKVERGGYSNNEDDDDDDDDGMMRTTKPQCTRNF